MSHDEFEFLAADLLAGQLPPEEEARLAAHLRRCADCRAAFARYLALWALSPLSPSPLEDQRPAAQASSTS